MTWVATIIVGALIGWIASLIMHTDEQQGPLADVIVGIVGSLLSTWLFGSVLGIGPAISTGSFSLTGILWGVLGSVVLIAILKMFGLLR